MSTGFFERIRQQKMVAPPATLPKQSMRPLSETEVYKRSVYTPYLPANPIPQVSVANPLNGFTGARNGQIVLHPSQVDGQQVVETYLVLEGVSK